MAPTTPLTTIETIDLIMRWPRPPGIELTVTAGELGQEIHLSISRIGDGRIFVKSLGPGGHSRRRTMITLARLADQIDDLTPELTIDEINAMRMPARAQKGGWE